MWTRARCYDLVFAVAWPLIILAFWSVARPPDHAELEAGRIAVVTLCCYLWGIASRRRS